MKLLFTTIVVLLALSVAYGQKYCCYPDKWEGTEGILSGSADDEGHSAITTGSTKISMDATMQAIYIEETMDVAGSKHEYTYLQLFAQNVMYVIVGNQCTRTTTGRWGLSNHCVPDNATMLRTYNLGNSDMFSITEYAVIFDQHTTVVGITEEGCVPALGRTYGNIDGSNIYAVSGYYNLTLGIKNPSVFNVPSICNQPTPLSTELPPVVYRRKRSLGAPIF